MAALQLLRRSGLSLLGRSTFGSQRLRFYQTSTVVQQEAEPEPEPVPISKLTDNFNNATSITYLEELERRYMSDPTSVDKTWASFFGSLDHGISPETVAEAFHAYQQGLSPQRASPLQLAATSNQTIHESMKLLLLIRAYQVSGHRAATLDPLGLEERPYPTELLPQTYGFTEADLNREFFVGVWPDRAGFLSEDRPVRSMKELLSVLKRTYCGNIGYEYMHIPDTTKCNWLRARIEMNDPPQMPPDKKIHALDRLAWSEMFETFLSRKYSAAKRFGLEGCETLIPGLKSMTDKAADLGVENVVMGMPHRGRLNVLANVVRKPLRQIFTEFRGQLPTVKEGEYAGSGDVKYHLGTSYDRPTAGETRRPVRISLMANPSHLEAVNTVVLGKARARQYYSADTDRSRTMPLLLHGDGAFAGQGIVYETLDMSQLPDYAVGGTVHVVVNNQVAFTTDPRKSRSSPYCTDVAKSLDCPIFHVNGDDQEAVIRACELAVEYRQEFKRDVVVDIVCYRKYGHNEIDEPSFTQPKMYQVIRQKKNPLVLYEEQLVKEGVITQEGIQAIHDKVNQGLNEEFSAAEGYEQQNRDWLASHWEGFLSPAQRAKIRNTGVDWETLKEVGEAITQLPDSVKPHKKIRDLMNRRRSMVETAEGKGEVDWGMAEALAFGTLLAEGNHVRLSGQDVERGTFSHRHAVVHDQDKHGKTFIPLNSINKGPSGQDLFTVSNSSLSEFGVLGFELGYSMESPNQLVCWEAQFGDFANGAQIIFDQFLSSGEAKWYRQSGLVVLLPHGYDGQGPEHSSARLERFLQQCDEDPFKLPDIDEQKWFSGGHLGSQTQEVNWQVVNCTTPANYFHVLRRQVHRQFRKPLIVMSPKALLRHPACKSYLYEFDNIPDDYYIEGVRFKRLIMDKHATDRSPRPEPNLNTKRLVLCTGKVYFDLDAYRDQLGLGDTVAIVRVEQIAPFPFDLVMRELRRYPNAEVTWCQEEPMNMGAYFHVLPRIHTCHRELGREITGYIKYFGRPPMASPSTGYAQLHEIEQKNLVHSAMDLGY